MRGLYARCRTRQAHNCRTAAKEQRGNGKTVVGARHDTAYSGSMTRFTVNGNPVHYRLPAETPLLWALRDASNLTGTKFGCGAGLCGACTVHVDGKATRSCQVAIGDIEGSFVTTIEGLSPDRSHIVQAAWIAGQVPQCGYCQSGMIMAVAALLKTTPHPTDDEIDAGVTNICRCGTYPRIRKRSMPLPRVWSMPASHHPARRRAKLHAAHHRWSPFREPAEASVAAVVPSVRRPTVTPYRLESVR